MLTLTGCLAPRAAVDVRQNLAFESKTAAYDFAAKKERAAERVLKADAEKAFANLQQQYEALVASANEGTDDPQIIASRGAQSVVSYQSGVAYTRALLDSKADTLYREVAFIRALGDVGPAISRMADEERAVTEKAFEDFVKAGGMEAIHSVFDTLEKKYLPPTLTPPPLPELPTETE